MFDSLESLNRAWKQAGKHGDEQARIERNARWIPYYSFLAAGREEAEAAIDPYAAEIAGVLHDQKLIREGETVLDIGSGTGGFTHAFAARGLRVTALEMDPASLSVCRAQAEQLGLPPLQYENGMWETFHPSQKFDFVFTSMCPAICDCEELSRMESYANHACGIVAVTHGSRDLHRKRLMELLNVRPTGGMTSEALWYYEALYLAGKQPDVRAYSRYIEYELPLEAAIRRYERYFEIFGISAEQARQALTAYFDPIAKNGMVRDTTLLNTALISWRV